MRKTLPTLLRTDALARVSMAVPLMTRILSGSVIVFLFIPCLVPHIWTGNEINYFDLAHRFVNPDAFGDTHAAKDSTNERMVSFLLMGSVIQALGMESAYFFFGTCLLIITPVSYFWFAHCWRIATLPAAVALFPFFMLRQSLVGAAYMFGTIEPKSFAYIAVLFGLGLAVANRRLAAVGALSVAAYLHFLVGGFWMLATLGLFALSDRSVRRTLPLLAAFIGLTLPLLFVIASERMGAISASTDLPLNAIYAEFRAPHHIAPFFDMSIFLSDWLDGVLLHLLLAIGLAVSAYRSRAPDRKFEIWLAGLNGYILLALMVAYLDRDTHVVAILYLFRPSSLILLLSSLWLAKRVLSSSFPPLRVAAPFLLAAWLGSNFSVVAFAASKLVYGHQPLASMLSPAESDLIAWIDAHTISDSVIVIQPVADDQFMGEGNGVWAGMERLLNRPTLVNFKFVPTDKTDLKDWYQLTLWRTTLFAGDCSVIHDYPVDYLITRDARTRQQLSACVAPVWRGGELSILQVEPEPGL